MRSVHVHLSLSLFFPFSFAVLKRLFIAGLYARVFISVDFRSAVASAAAAAASRDSVACEPGRDGLSLSEIRRRLAKGKKKKHAFLPLLTAHPFLSLFISPYIPVSLSPRIARLSIAARYVFSVLAWRALTRRFIAFGADDPLVSRTH